MSDSASSGFPALGRRVASISAIGVACLLSTSLLPAWLLAALVIDALRAPRGKGLATCRLLGYGLCFLWIEALAIAALGVLGLATIGSPERRRAGAYALQRRYVAANLAAVKAAFQLRFEVEGDSGREVRGPLTVFVRHSSLIDVLIPGVFVANRFGLRLRYVLKQELLWSPCLDIAGHWMPNHFVDRSGDATDRERDAIHRLQEGLTPGEGVILYPEGTRFTEAKRQRALERLASDPEALARAQHLRHLLPPKPTGALALLQGKPPREVLFVGHSGLEGFSSLRDIWSGALLRKTVRVRFWWEPPESIPSAEEAQRAWLADRWQALDDWLELTEPPRTHRAA